VSIEANKALVQEFFRRMQAGDPALAELLAEDVTWWVPQSSQIGGTHRGREAVLGLMGWGVKLYEPPLTVVIEEIVAEGESVCVQFVIEAKTAAGRPDRNDYHFAFRVRGGRIAAVREYLDTKYAEELLFS